MALLQPTYSGGSQRGGHIYIFISYKEKGRVVGGREKDCSRDGSEKALNRFLWQTVN